MDRNRYTPINQTYSRMEYVGVKPKQSKNLAALRGKSSNSLRPVTVDLMRHTRPDDVLSGTSRSFFGKGRTWKVPQVTKFYDFSEFDEYTVLNK